MGPCNCSNSSPATKVCPRGLTVMSMSSMRATPCQRQKYLSPPGRSNMLYLAPGVSQLLLRDESLPNMITEGEFKTLALWRLAIHGSPSRPRFLPLGVSGVYNWRGTIGKTVGPDGSRLDVKGAIPDLDWVAWQGRHVVIAYDADAVTKDQPEEYSWSYPKSRRTGD